MTSNAFWTQGEVQVGRRSSDPAPVDLHWTQGVLVRPPVLEVRLRVGLIPQDDHVRLQLEVLNPSTSELLAMHSIPHRPLSELDDEMARMGVRLRDVFDQYLDRDPF